MIFAQKFGATGSGTGKTGQTPPPVLRRGRLAGRILIFRIQGGGAKAVVSAHHKAGGGTAAFQKIGAKGRGGTDLGDLKCQNGDQYSKGHQQQPADHQSESGVPECFLRNFDQLFLRGFIVGPLSLIAHGRFLLLRYSKADGIKSLD